MKINIIELEGFQSWREKQVVDLSETDLVAVVGPVHSGKSSLVNAVEWGLWATSRGGLADDVINDDSSMARVRIEFEAAGQVYQVIRVRTRSGRYEAYLSVADPNEPSGWAPIDVKQHPSAVDPAIVEVMGMDESLSALTWLVRQNDYGAFCRMDAPKRREVLARAFGLDKYTVMAKQAEEAGKAQNEAVSKARWTLDRLVQQTKDSVSEVNGFAPEADPSWRTELDEWDGDGTVDHLLVPGILDRMAEASAGLQAEIEDVNSAIAQADRSGPEAARDEIRKMKEDHATVVAAWRTRSTELNRRAQAAQRSLATSRSRLERATEAATKLDPMATSLAVARDRNARLESLIASTTKASSSASARLTAIEAERTSLDAQREDLTDRLAALEHTSGHCVVCESELTGEQVSSLRSKTQSELDRIDDATSALDQEADELTGAVASSQAETKGHQRDLSAGRQEAEQLAEELSAARMMAEERDEALSSVQSATEEIEMIDIELSELGDEPQLDSARLAELQELAAGGSVSEDLVARRTDLQSRLAQAQEDHAAAKRAVKVIEKTLAELAVAKETLATDQQRLADIMLVREGFRPAGIPAMILAGVVDELNAEANLVMADTGDDGLTVQVSTKMVKAKGDTSEKVMVYAVTATGRLRSYQSLSGSEQFRVALAVRLGLARCIARRTGTPVKLIVLDEGWGNLDEPSRRGVAAVLERLAASGFRVITISHVDDVKDSFTHLVQVDASTGTSTAEVVSL